MKPKRLGIGDKDTDKGDPQDMGLNERSTFSNKEKLRGETSVMEQRPTILKTSVKSDRGTFKCK